MNEEGRLPGSARTFLVVVGLLADGTKVGLEAAFGIGVILDPVLISPVTCMIFWVTLNHNGIAMFSGSRGWIGWTNLLIAETPVVDALPDWTMYALCV